MRLLYWRQNKIRKFELIKRDIMSGVALKKENSTGVTIVKKTRDYSNDPFVRKKAEQAKAFIKKHGLPESFKKKK